MRVAQQWKFTRWKTPLTLCNGYFRTTLLRLRILQPCKNSLRGFFPLLERAPWKISSRCCGIRSNPYLPCCIRVSYRRFEVCDWFDRVTFVCDDCAPAEAMGAFEGRPSFEIRNDQYIQEDRGPRPQSVSRNCASWKCAVVRPGRCSRREAWSIRS